MSEPVNALHASLRMLAQEGGIEAAIQAVHAQIDLRGYDVVKADLGVRAFVEENVAVLKPIADLMRGKVR